MDDASRAWVGLGSNLANPVWQVTTAVARLDALESTRVTAVSALYRSAPVGGPDQPEYVNAVAALETRTGPVALMAALLRLEMAQGRIRGPHRWGPRTLDLDLLMYGSRRMRMPGLELPHPRAHLRAFVLIPLNDLSPGLQIPGRGNVRELAGRCDSSGVHGLGVPGGARLEPQD